MHRLKTFALRSILLGSAVAGFANAARSEPPILAIAHASLPPTPSLTIIPAAYRASPGVPTLQPAEPDPRQRWQARHRFNLCLQSETLRQAKDASLPVETIIGGAFSTCATSAETMNAERQAKLARLLGMLVAMQRMRAGETTLAAVEAGP